VVIEVKGANHPSASRASTLFDLPYALYAYSVGFSLGPSTSDLHGSSLSAALHLHAPAIATAAIVFGTLGAAGVLGALRLGRREAVALVSWFFVPLVLALVMAASTPNPFNVRYAIVSYPAFAILIGLGIGAPGVAERPRRAGGGPAAGVRGGAR